MVGSVNLTFDGTWTLTERLDRTTSIVRVYYTTFWSLKNLSSSSDVRYTNTLNTNLILLVNRSMTSGNRKKSLNK